MGTAAADISERLSSLTRAYPDPAGTLDALIVALMEPSQIVDDVARDTDTTEAWGSVRDPDATDARFLGWLAQFPGVTFPPGATEAEKRDRIRHNPGFDDGKTEALRAEVARTLTGEQAVRIFKFTDGFATRMTVVTRTSETPDADLTLAAAMRQKPAGIKLTHVVTSFALIGDLEAEYETIGDVEADFATIGDMEDWSP